MTMNNEQVTLIKSVVKGDIKQFQATMQDMINQRIVIKMRERRDNMMERYGFKRLQDK